MNDEELNTLAQAIMILMDHPMGWNTYELNIADLILRICNIYYNNTSMEVLPLSDGVYDQLLIAYRYYNPNYQVGAVPIQFDEKINVEYAKSGNEKKRLYTVVSDSDMDSKLYARNLQAQHTPIYHIGYPSVRDINDPLISKRLINTEHKYPELVGTLDKCKFVLNHDAQIANAFDNPTVQIFERDFIHSCMNSGLILPDQVFEMVGELKYDGISVEAEVCGDKIISAYSRGDTGENIATDLTPILKHYNFYNAKNVPTDITFGIKFEAVITKRNLELLGELRGKEYKNGRNAIIGLFGSSDAFRYVDYITLIPLATSMDMHRLDELIFLNKYYNTGEYNRYCVFKGNYQEILFQVKQFTESAEIIRPILPYMIDGVVISFIDPKIISILGRVNSVNKYQMAIKFNPREVRTIFEGYTYNIGKSGEVIPMAHFKPVEFIGTIHTKQTIHSLQRFKELSLVRGQEIDITYVNDVLTYVEKPDTDYNRVLQYKATDEDEFITHCPYCGSPIEISDSGKSARCPNIRCHERQIMRMVYMIDSLGFKDISEDVVRKLDLTSFNQLMFPWDVDSLSNILGPLTAEKFIKYCNDLRSNPIEDYKIMAALSFEGMGEEKWKRILKAYDLRHLASMLHRNINDLYYNLNMINGVGNMTVSAIVSGFTYFADEIDCIINNLNIIDSKSQKQKPKVALTGTRDQTIIEALNKLGYDCSDKYGVTKNIAFLITNDKNSKSGKMAKAAKYGKPIYTFSEFCRTYNIDPTKL